MQDLGFGFIGSVIASTPEHEISLCPSERSSDARLSWFCVRVDAAQYSRASGEPGIARAGREARPAAHACNAKSVREGHQRLEWRVGQELFPAESRLSNRCDTRSKNQ